MSLNRQNLMRPYLLCMQECVKWLDDEREKCGFPGGTTAHLSGLLDYNPGYCLGGPFHLQARSTLLSIFYPPLNWSGPPSMYSVSNQPFQL